VAVRLRPALELAKVVRRALAHGRARAHDLEPALDPAIHAVRAAASGISRSMARSASSPSATWTRIDARKCSAIARSLNRVPRAL
jgi:hypothetical protein